MTRSPLPVTRASITRRFRLIDQATIVGPDGKPVIVTRPFGVKATVGLYPDGKPGELWLAAGRSGETTRGLLDMAAIASSLYLQHGGSLLVLAEKWRAMKFRPDGFTGDPQFPNVTSIADYLARWMMAKWSEETHD